MSNLDHKRLYEPEGIFWDKDLKMGTTRDFGRFGTETLVLPILRV
jgi:hypothetical protein